MSSYYLNVMDAIQAGKYPNVENALTDAIAVYRGLALDSKELEALQGRAKQIITEIMQETGQVKAVTTSGTAQFTAASIRIAYDWKALDALCASDETLAHILKPHRSEKQVAGALLIKG